MKPVRSEAHLRWIKTLPCVVFALNSGTNYRTGCVGMIDPAHTGPHGMNQKASDLDAIPLCRKHHEELGGPGGRRAFEQKYAININEILERLRKKPRIFIQKKFTVPGSTLFFERWFMAEMEGDSYFLCPVSACANLGPYGTGGGVIPALPVESNRPGESVRISAVQTG